MKTYPNCTLAYHGLLKDVYNTPEFEAAPRGMKVRERLGHSFRITNIRDRIPYIPHRKFSIAYMLAELIWYVSADDSTEWIANYSGFWRNISDDGVTANSAYGRRIFVPHDRIAGDVEPQWNQWDYVKEELSKDPDSRRAVIHIRSPKDSIYAHKDVPCTLSLQFFIRDGALHQVASMRSSDLILGIAYDIPAFTFFQELLAAQLGVKCGTYTHISNSLHIYERHYEMVEKILKDPWVKEFPTRAQEMPPLINGFVSEDIGQLRSADASFRDIKDSNTLLQAALACTGPVDDYFKDWVLVLASHRARQLGDDDLRKKLIDSVEFQGFKLFDK